MWGEWEVDKDYFILLTVLCPYFSSGLELIASKWAHSLVEFDLAWGNAQKPLDSALRALAEKRGESRLK